MPEQRLFLERRSYRRRRMMDAVRMLPLLCTVLWLVVPLMWPKGEQVAEHMPLSLALWYLFVIWMLAITASFALWRRIRRSDGEESRAEDPVEAGADA
ncbi:hypothetical protein [Sulfitobacter guttiformis]|uniref:Uncharacterized protein n=1 Tax=Sulfitobacter guttiformis TaxID=74349 RepID=A0A420DIU2_9RHOB|nr:hypothetical protein [Sulfitobacter guttiformis]KIN72067.1 hypothetical protein Z949_1236 [Sulfitobacter guttiformis KCTC 32187]RKE94153.1 hypothetical protein C8N30_3262 [Sulfitobacter guttiformis]